jgi:hypothetical protein
MELLVEDEFLRSADLEPVLPFGPATLVGI